MSGLKLSRAKRVKHVAQRRSKHQEGALAKRVGGKITKGSGATDYEKGDVRKYGVLRLEAKTTAKKSFSVKITDVEKITEYAMNSAKAEIPVMIIEFVDDDGKPLAEVALIPTQYLEELTGLWR